MHPEIEKFYINIYSVDSEQYSVSKIAGSLIFGVDNWFLGNSKTQYISQFKKLAYKEKDKAIIYKFEDNEYSEEDMLRLIKIKSFV
jgi:hypothetical protein